MSEETREVPAFACCSVGIGRWFWVAWESESDARALSPALASGFEKSAARGQGEGRRAGRPPVEAPPRQVGLRLQAGWRRWHGAPLDFGRRLFQGRQQQPGPRPGSAAPPTDPVASAERPISPSLHSATERDPPDALGHVAVARHRIVRQKLGEIFVECDPFDEDGWTQARGEAGGESPVDSPKTRHAGHRSRGESGRGERFRRRHAHRELMFYASEQDGIRDVEAALTAKSAWCTTLGVRFPCSADSIKTAYRRLVMTSHPDAGGDPAEFRAVHRAYREALAYFAQADDTAGSPTNHNWGSARIHAYQKPRGTYPSKTSINRITSSVPRPPLGPIAPLPGVGPVSASPPPAGQPAKSTRSSPSELSFAREASSTRWGVERSRYDHSQCQSTSGARIGSFEYGLSHRLKSEEIRRGADLAVDDQNSISRSTPCFSTSLSAFPKYSDRETLEVIARIASCLSC